MVLAAASYLIRALAVHSVPGDEMGVVGKIQERLQLGVNTQKHISTVPAVAAIRTAAIHILLPTETNNPIPSAPTADRNASEIDKHRAFSLLSIHIGREETTRLVAVSGIDRDFAAAFGLPLELHDTI